MGAWLAPVSRVLTHASASLRRLDREAGIITLFVTGEGQKTSSVLNRALSRIETKIQAETI